MQFFKAITLFSLIATGLAAAAAEPQSNKVVVGEGEPFDGDFEGSFLTEREALDDDFEDDFEGNYLAERSDYMINKRGYGCPNDYACSSYCSSIGRNGGHCGGFLWRVCKCNEKK